MSVTIKINDAVAVDKAHEDWKILMYAQLMFGRKLTVGEALKYIGAC